MGTPPVVTWDHLPPCCATYNGSNGISLCANIAPGFIPVNYTENGLVGFGGTVGVGPGVAAPQSAVDLSASGGITPGASVFETAPPDLVGYTLAWLLDPSGYPVFYSVY
jgi:hypothetical protein